MIVPLIITATGVFFFYSSTGLAHSYVGIIMAHATLGISFVIIAVTATLVDFDHSLTSAAPNLRASPTTVFKQIMLPLILPGVISGALFAFVTSFDEVVVVLFAAAYDHQTIPHQIWHGIHEQISPTKLSVATILVYIFNTAAYDQRAVAPPIGTHAWYHTGVSQACAQITSRKTH